MGNYRSNSIDNQDDRNGDDRYYPSCFEKLLPDYFITGKGKEERPYIQRAITELSQLMAWTWTSLTVTNKPSEEQELKKYYSSLLQELAMQTAAFEHYNDTNQEKEAKSSSKKLKKLFLGEKTSDWDKDMTLDRVIQDLTSKGKRFVFTEKPNFTKKFIFLAQIGLDAGTITELSVDETSSEEEKKFLVRLCIPPRPTLSEYTITEEQLYDWARQVNTGGNYIPSFSLPLLAS